MTILMTVYLRASYHRHIQLHRVNRIGKPLPRYHDGRDAHEGHLRANSRQGAHLYFVGSLTASNEPDEPDAEDKEFLPYTIFEAPAASGLSNPPDDPTMPPDDGPPLSSGLSRTLSGQQPEPDDNKYLTYA
jgi:hypothetical protein